VNLGRWTLPPGTEDPAALLLDRGFLRVLRARVLTAGADLDRGIAVRRSKGDVLHPLPRLDPALREFGGAGAA
jgi:hypothetical protein